MKNASPVVAAFAIVALLFVVACAPVRPFRATPIALPAHVGLDRRDDSARAFFDSLGAARATERGRRGAHTPAVMKASALTDLAWLDILDDSILKAIVRVAIVQNRDVVLGRARIEEFRALTGVARSSLLPRIAANGASGTNQVVVGASPAVGYDLWRATGDAAWDLDVSGRARHGVNAANADLAAQEAGQRATELSLVSEVALGYLQLLELDEEHAIAVRTLASRRAMLVLAQERFERGVVSEVDVRQFEAQLAVPSARLAQVVRQRAQQEHALNVLLGESPMTIQRGSSLIAATRAVTVPDSLPATLLDRRPDVVQAEREYAAVAARVGATAAARLPAVSIAGLYGTQSASVGKLLGSRTNVYQLQAGVSVPLLTGGRQRGDLTAARARMEQARAVYERTALTALREASDALVAVRTAHDEVTANETLEGALRRALELSDLRYQTGVASFLEVLDAQRGLFDAELTLSQSRLRELSAAVQLYKALGASWVHN